MKENRDKEDVRESPLLLHMVGGMHNRKKTSGGIRGGEATVPRFSEITTAERTCEGKYSLWIL